MQRLFLSSLRIAFFLAAVLFASGFFISVDIAHATYGDTTTLVGKPYDGDGGQANAALLDFAEDITSDADGNFYIADTLNHAIRKVTPAGIISTFAGGGYGFGDGQGTNATFNAPRGVAADGNGNIYIADTGNNAVRKISTAGAVSTLVSEGLKAPYDVEVAGSTVFISDTENGALKSVSTSGGSVTTITTALSDARKIAVTSNGAFVYVADAGSHRVLKVDVAGSAISVVAGDGTQGYQEGTGSAAQFQTPWGVALNAAQTKLYVSDPDLYLTDRIRVLDLATGTTSLFAADTTQELMIGPAGVHVRAGNVYVVAAGQGIVRRFAESDANDTAVFAGTTRFGSREGSDPLFGRPNDMALSADGKTLYLTENNRIRKVDLATKTTTAIIGSIVDNYREGIPEGPGTENLEEARFSSVAGIAVTRDERTIYVADRWNNRIRKIDLTATPYRSSLVTGAGRINSTGDTENGYQEGGSCDQIVDRFENLTLRSGCAYFRQPIGIVLDPTEQYLYVSDSGNVRIRRVRLADGSTTLIAGSTSGYADGTGDAAQFATPWGLTLNDDGTMLYVADRDAHRIRAIDLATKKVTTLAGTGTSGYREGIGTAAAFSLPKGLRMGADGLLYIADSGSQRIRVLDPATGLTKLVAGSGTKGYSEGGQKAVKFNGLGGLAPDTSRGVLYISDSSNDVVRSVDILGAAPYTDPAPTVTAAVPREADPRWAVKDRLNIQIKGTGFKYGATVSFASVKATKTYVISSKEIVATLPLSKMAPGWYDIIVTNLDGQYGALESGFGLRDPQSGKDSITSTVPGTFFTVSALRGFSGLPKTYRTGMFLALGDVWGDGRKEIVLGGGAGNAPLVRVFSQTGERRASFFAFAKKTRTGARVATCDTNGDGVEEILAVPGNGKTSMLKIFTTSGRLLRSWPVRSSPSTGGAALACGDVTGDGTPDILLGIPQKKTSTIVQYTVAGTLTKSFTVPFRSPELAIADVNGNGTADVLIAPRTGAGRPRAHDASGRLLKTFPAPFGTRFAGGVSVASGDTNGDGTPELVWTPLGGIQTKVRITTLAGTLRKTFSAFPRVFTGGTRVSVGDVSGDGIADIVVVPATNFPPSVRMFTPNGKPL